MKQLSMNAGYTFTVPDRPDFTMFDRWLQLLVGELPKVTWPVIPSENGSAAASLAMQWLVRGLSLTRLLLHLARIPAFDAPHIIECEPAPKDGSWRAWFQFPTVEDLPIKVLDAALGNAFKLAHWVAANEPTAAKMEVLGKALNEAFINPSASIWSLNDSTFQVLRAAHARDIPFRKLDGGVYQLGWGARARRIDRSVTEHVSAIGARLSSNKAMTAKVLRAHGLPAPVHKLVGDLRSAQEAAQQIGWPVVLKPVDGERGEGVTLGVEAETLEVAFNEALAQSKAKRVVVERQVAGVCHRVFVAGGRLLYAVKRLPIGVYGNGHASVFDLVEAELAAEKAKPVWARSKLKPLDDLARATLAAGGLTEQSVPAAGQFIALRSIEKTVWGGVDEEVTASIHPENLRVAIAAAAAIGLDVVGVDIISPDISQPWHANGAIINEVNYAPLLGGGEISRRSLPEFIERLMGGQGTIAIAVFVGGDAAWQGAQRYWQSRREQADGVFLTNAATTIDGSGQEVPMALEGLHARARALTLSQQVHELVLVVQTDEFLHLGLPLESVGAVVEVDRDLAAYHDRTQPVTDERKQALCSLLRAWESKAR